MNDIEKKTVSLCWWLRDLISSEDDRQVWRISKIVATVFFVASAIPSIVWMVLLTYLWWPQERDLVKTRVTLPRIHAVFMVGSLLFFVLGTHNPAWLLQVVGFAIVTWTGYLRSTERPYRKNRKFAFRPVGSMG